MDNVIEGAATTPAAEVQPRPTVARQALLGGLAVALFLAAILAFGAYLRMVGRNWDESQSLHPDERFLTMVTAAVGEAEAEVGVVMVGEAADMVEAEVDTVAVVVAATNH